MLLSSQIELLKAILAKSMNDPRSQRTRGSMPVGFERISKSAQNQAVRPERSAFTGMELV